MARRLVVVGCLLALLVRGDIDYAEISFYPPPPEKCAPTEITLTFEIAGGLQHGESAGTPRYGIRGTEPGLYLVRRRMKNE